MSDNIDNGDSHDPYLNAFTDLSAAMFVAREWVGQAERRVEWELLLRVAGSEQAFQCERCAALVWVEMAEDSRPILVNGDGSPHEDHCRAERAPTQGLLFEIFPLPLGEPLPDLSARADTPPQNPADQNSQPLTGDSP